MERGARNVTLKSIANLAQALEVTVAHLLAKPEPA
ncbi:MAG TPA: transcriptional regulator, partial [Phycisphaerae bacterium]|nr:transcriptional regulator [Phycisphaerae bacterium]